MSLDWSNERYVRFYTRETPDQAVWCWQALALWPWLIARADRAGLIETRKGLKGISSITRLPLEVVELGISDLLEDGCLREIPSGYVIPNYVEAQSARSSPSQRKADQRARDRMVTAMKSTGTDNRVTKSHTESHGVTRSHTESHDVPSIFGPPKKGGSKGPSAPKTAKPGTDKDHALTDMNCTDGSKSVTTCHSEPSRADLKREEETPPLASLVVPLKLVGPVATKSRAAPRHRIPEAWKPREEHFAKAIELGVDIADAAEEFVQYWTAEGEVKANWDQAFHLWLRRKQKYDRARRGNGGGHDPQAQLDRQLARVAMLEARDAAVVAAKARS